MHSGIDCCFTDQFPSAREDALDQSDAVSFDRASSPELYLARPSLARTLGP
jgi:hypothetical protein